MIKLVLYLSRVQHKGAKVTELNLMSQKMCEIRSKYSIYNNDT